MRIFERPMYAVPASGRSSSVAVAIRQQSEESRALNRLRQLTLVARLGAGDTARHDLAGFGDVLAQGVEILVIDLLGTFSGETAEFLAAKKFGHGNLRNLEKRGLFGFGARRSRRTFAARFVVFAKTKAFVVAATAAFVVLVLEDEGLIRDRLIAQNDEMAQHGVVEAKTGLQFLQYALSALDVHHHIVRFGQIVDRVGNLTAAPIFQTMNLALVRLDHRLV